MDAAARGRFDDKLYVVQTVQKVIQRGLLMTTDAGDLLVLDPISGRGTTASSLNHGAVGLLDLGSCRS